MLRLFSVLGMCGLCALSIGCGKTEVATQPLPPSSGVDASFLASSEPTDSTPVKAAREETVDGQEATLVGVIGGSKDPFVEGLAAFTIVDPSIPSCAAEEGCPTPWDYCCTQDQVRDAIATVKMVDAAGAPVAVDARELLGVKELSEVAVSGKVIRDDEGNLTLAANKVFIKTP